MRICDAAGVTEAFHQKEAAEYSDTVLTSFRLASADAETLGENWRRGR